MKTLTQDRLRELLEYHPETGQFIWRVSPRPNIKAGSVAGYARTNGTTRTQIDDALYSAGPLAIFFATGSWPTGRLTYLNGNRSDTRLLNLVEQASPVALKVARQANPQGFRGVSYHKASGKYMAHLHANGRGKHVGVFDSPQQAHEALQQARVALSLSPLRQPLEAAGEALCEAQGSPLNAGAMA